MSDHKQGQVCRILTFTLLSVSYSTRECQMLLFALSLDMRVELIDRGLGMAAPLLLVTL